MKSPLFRSIGPAAPRYIPNFDSASGLLRALSNYLNGKDFPGMGAAPAQLKPLGLAINRLPRQAREQLYTWSGWSEAIPEDRLKDVRVEEASKWATNLYPQRTYPAVMVGSSNGAAVHLGAALGIPWLPQTFLVPVRRTGVHPDEPADDLEWGRDPGRTLLDANPELQLHHMHDPSQDRLMVQRMALFRIKRRTLGPAYEHFLRRQLVPGGTIFLIECTRSWPTVQVGERHVFQTGGMGSTGDAEYIEGSERVVRFLEHYESHRRDFAAPIPDGESPEAEWGFAPALGDDVDRFAREHGFQVKRIRFEEPEHLSPLVADLYRNWYRERRIQANRLLLESFVLLEPYWALRTGSVPFWLKFNMQPSLDSALHYLGQTEPFDDINLMLFNHGTDSIGMPSVDDWRAVLHQARRHGAFVGLDEERFPRDFASFVTYNTEIQKVPARYPLPGPLSLSRLDAFIAEHGDRYQVEWSDHLNMTRAAAD